MHFIFKELPCCQRATINLEKPQFYPIQTVQSRYVGLKPHAGSHNTYTHICTDSTAVIVEETSTVMWTLYICNVLHRPIQEVSRSVSTPLDSIASKNNLTSNCYKINNTNINVIRCKTSLIKAQLMISTYKLGILTNLICPQSKKDKTRIYVHSI